MGMLPESPDGGSPAPTKSRKKKARKKVEPRGDKFAKRSILKNITLPSRGLLYGEDCPDGKVQVAAFTTREEKVFAAQGMNADDKITYALKNCVDAGSLTVEDMLVGDSLFCLFWIRAISYSTSYGWEVQCSSCRRMYRKEIRLPHDLELTEAPDSYEEPYYVDLPHNGDRLGLRVFRRRDEAWIEREVSKATRKRAQLGDPSYMLRLGRHIVTINDEEVGGIMRAAEYSQNLEGPDSLAFRNAIDQNTYGYELEAPADCVHCGYAHSIDVPVTGEFFRPQS